MIYKFSKLEEKMDSWGFPKLNTNSGFRVIKTDFEKEYKAGNIRFGDDGIYLTINGEEHKGYMYMPTYRIEHYGSVSRFHLVRCDVIDKFITANRFKTFYRWSNDKNNDITDRDTNIVHKSEVLHLCSKCKSLIMDSIDDTEDFFSTLNSDEQEKTTTEVDIFGYDKHWQKISKLYRKKHNYSCEHCGLKITNRSDYRYLHVHHINGKKDINTESNLKCLCSLCHSQVDKVHNVNFSKNRMKNDIIAFVNKYRSELKKVSNPHLSLFK